MNLPKYGNSANEQLMMDHFMESRRYIFLFHFISMNKDQLKMNEISASLDEISASLDDHPLVPGLALESFIDKLDPYINGLRNNNEEVDIFNFNDFEQLIQSFKFEYFNLSKSENSSAKQLMMDYFKESKRYIFLFYFFTINKDQIKMSYQ
ncbi:hypothetical protein ACTFIY_011845 [Dictyostelium cf. discoideum]